MRKGIKSKINIKNETFVPHLSCGIFFNLIKEKSKNSMKDIICDFAHLFTLDVELIDMYDKNDNALTTNISDLTHCNVNKPTKLPFSKKTKYFNEFKEAITSSNQEKYKQFKDVINSHLTSSDNREWVVKAIIDIIKKDTDIPDEATIHLNYDNSVISKKELLK